MSVRTTVKGLIVRDNKLLVVRKINILKGFDFVPEDAVYYDLPGGGQSKYESLEEALVRECSEETGYAVQVGDCVGVTEIIEGSPTFRRCHSEYAHKIYFIFKADVSQDKEDKSLIESDKELGYDGVEWIPLNDIKDVPLFPTIVKKNISSLLESKHTLYLM